MGTLCSAGEDHDPSAGGAVRNTGYLALQHARTRRDAALPEGAPDSDVPPWRQAVRDAQETQETSKLAEKYLVRV